MGLNQPALFSNAPFSMKKGVWRSQIHYELSENKKKSDFDPYGAGGTLCLPFSNEREKNNIPPFCEECFRGGGF